MSFLKGLLLLAHVFTLFEEYDCDATFTQVGDTQLLFVNEVLPFADAERYCESKDSKLVEFWSIAEWKEFVAWLKVEGLDGKAFWIGQTDALEEGEFKWRSGHQSSFNESELWASGEPGGGEGQNCVFVPSLKWQDLECTRKSVPVCQKRSSTEGTQNRASNTAEKVICDVKEVVIVMIVLQGVVIILLIGNIAFVGYCMHQNKARPQRASLVEMDKMPAQAYGGDGGREDNIYDEVYEFPEENAKEGARESVASYYVE